MYQNESFHKNSRLNDSNGMNESKNYHLNNNKKENHTDEMSMNSFHKTPETVYNNALSYL